jgi:hypothetical protein
MVWPPSASRHLSVYEEDGFVDDDDAASIDYTKLLK